MDSRCHVTCDQEFIALIILNQLIDKEISGDCLRSVSNSLCHFSLQAFRKGIVTFTGNNGKYVYIMNVVAQSINIHTLTVLIDTKPKSATYFLALTDIAAALLQCANLENIRIIPSFTKSGM